MIVYTCMSLKNTMLQRFLHNETGFRHFHKVSQRFQDCSCFLHVKPGLGLLNGRWRFVQFVTV